MSRKKIVILGGGVGALTTAWALTNEPGWEQKYEITLYQMGWRLGGKGASGRSAAYGNRIEEHGLHMWMGFYENAFTTIREVYEHCAAHGLMPDSPLQSYRQAFTPLDRIAITEEVRGTLEPWILPLPRTEQYPGDPAAPPADSCPVVWAYLDSLLGLCIASMEDFGGTELPFGLGDDAASLLRQAKEIALSLVRNEQPAASAAGILPLIRAFQATTGLADAVLDIVSWDDDNTGIRQLRLILDLALSTVRGIIADDVFQRGFTALDDEEFADWLIRHGCRNARNPVTTAFYDACFAYAEGSTAINSQNMAAGTMLNGILRLAFTYHGSMMFRMNGGMGDVVFAPLYLALKHRGVRFEFFHRVRALGMSGDGRQIDSVLIDVQATLRGVAYDPLVMVKGMPCWPAAPLAEQLEQDVDASVESWWEPPAPVGAIELRRGTGFDVVVNGLALGTQRYVAEAVVSAKPAWQRMVNGVALVRTQAFQLWLSKGIGDLTANLAQPEIHTGYVEPFDTWADMSHLIPFEEVDGTEAVAYFCNALPAAGQPDAAVVELTARHFLAGPMLALWPGAARHQGFDPSLLVDFSSRGPQHALASQYFRANTDPSELYVQSLAGTTSHRLSPGGSGFDNMVLAGDWTLGTLNIGCVEAAVESGMMAANAISGQPGFLKGAFGRRVPIQNGALAPGH